MCQLKAASICMRLYRNRLGRHVRAVEVIKAVASSGSIGAWVIWKDYPLVWGAIIAAAQVLDALKGVFSFVRQHRAACDLTVALELLCIDAELEWEGVYSGALSEDAISVARARLKRLQLEAERKHFPEGLELPAPLIELASREATAYFQRQLQIE